MKEFKQATEQCHREFEHWRDQHPSGFVVNRRERGEAMLHRGRCMHLRFRPGEPVLLTRKAKYCSIDRGELEAWAKEGRISLVRCASCDV